jgi:hypothetical protein
MLLILQISLNALQSVALMVIASLLMVMGKVTVMASQVVASQETEGKAMLMVIASRVRIASQTRTVIASRALIAGQTTASRARSASQMVKATATISLPVVVAIVT